MLPWYMLTQTHMSPYCWLYICIYIYIHMHIYTYIYNSYTLCIVYTYVVVYIIYYLHLYDKYIYIHMYVCTVQYSHDITHFRTKPFPSLDHLGIDTLLAEIRQSTAQYAAPICLRHLTTRKFGLVSSNMFE